MKYTAVLATALLATVAHADTVFDNLPAALPGNYPSLGYQATQTSEFGNRIGLGGTARLLNSITVGMSSWATGAPGTTFTHDLTINIYGAGSGNAPGALLGTSTQTFTMPYHDGTNGFSGTAFLATFNLASLSLTLPDQIVIGLAYNTANYGANPMGSNGPWNSLNFGLIASAPTVGTDLDPDDVMWNTSTAGWYTDGGAAGVGVFRQDTNWTGYAPAIRVDAISSV
ncbi:MAG: hypothetical protein EOP84_36545, partial [Verrucomicrobiaceae bacterium]